MSVLKQRLERITMSKPTIHKQMAVFALIDKGASKASYLLMDDAIANGCAKVTEISDSGSVPELAFRNECDQRVFLMEGEELVGAKQNRTLNLSILVPAGKEIKIPVTCVESGRWSYDTPAFKRSDRAHFAKGRRSKMASVSYYIESSDRPMADQGEVWESISKKAEAMRSHSRTSAMGDIFEDHRDDIEQYVEAFSPVEDQVGMLVMVGDDLVGLDIFDCSVTLRKMMPKLIRSFALDALEEKSDVNYRPDHSAAESLIDKCTHADFTTHEGVGEGQNIRFLGDEIVGGALLDGDSVIHLSAFRNDEDKKGRRRSPRSGVRRASNRRRGQGEGGASSSSAPLYDEDYLDIPEFLRTQRE